MRIDSTSAMTAPPAPDSPSVTRAQPSADHNSEAFSSSLKQTQTALIAPQLEVSVQVDNDKHMIYRFFDGQTGDLVQQLPPEELLRVMRNIGELLQESEQRLSVNG